MVLLDSSSNVRMNVVTKVDKIDSPLQGEFKAILFGLEVVGISSFSSLVVESDSLIVCCA